MRKVVAHVFQPYFKALYQRTMSSAYETAFKSTDVTVVSRAMIPEAIRLGADPARVHVLPKGLDFDGLFFPGPAEVRQPRQILVVGRLVEKEGLRHRIDAMHAILEQVPKTRLRIVGGGPKETTLRAQARLPGTASLVDFLGPRPQAKFADLYRRASMFVAPFVEADLRVDPKQPQELVDRIIWILKHLDSTAARVLGIRDRPKPRLGWASIAAACQRGSYGRLERSAETIPSI